MKSLFSQRFRRLRSVPHNLSSAARQITGTEGWFAEPPKEDVTLPVNVWELVTILRGHMEKESDSEVLRGALGLYEVYLEDRTAGQQLRAVGKGWPPNRFETIGTHFDEPETSSRIFVACGMYRVQASRLNSDAPDLSEHVRRAVKFLGMVAQEHSRERQFEKVTKAGLSTVVSMAAHFPPRRPNRALLSELNNWMAKYNLA